MVAKDITASCRSMWYLNTNKGLFWSKNHHCQQSKIIFVKLLPLSISNYATAFITGVLCLLCCTISMAFAHGAGNYVFILFDNFSGNFPLLIIAFFECIGVAYVYGLKR
jgi:solute carrier family 6 amino acid/orphan transporter-like 15/16/17/18/20